MEPVRRILLVEDEPDIRASLKDLLEMQIPGATVALAANGAEGLRAMTAHRPDLIITDYKMPGMNGLEFLEAARAASPDTPRVLMTAYPDLEVATRAINEAHIENFLAKPVEPEEMIEKIVRILQLGHAKLEKERSLARSLRELAQTIDGTRK
ncbi:MAG TPA: response regulator [Candidatus Thermoplasmatota archaeon]|nr:response regulator [Candidatus Thermoplasmatota archaeon]